MTDAQAELRQRLPAKTLAFLRQRGASKARPKPAAATAAATTTAARPEPAATTAAASAAAVRPQPANVEPAQKAVGQDLSGEASCILRLTA